MNDQAVKATPAPKASGAMGRVLRLRRRVLFGTAAHHQVIGLVLGIVIAASGVFVVRTENMAGVERSIAQAHRLSSPAGRDLATATHEWTLALADYKASLTGDVQASARWIAEGQAGQDAWSAFKKSSLHLKGEAPLAAQYEAAVKGLAAGAATLTQAPGGLTNLASIQALYESVPRPLVALQGLYVAAVADQVGSANAHLGSIRFATDLAAAVFLLLVIVMTAVVFRNIRKREHEVAVRDAQQRHEAGRGEIETRLQRALELINNEEDSYQVIELALALAAPNVPAELLVADSSRAHFHQVACTDGAAPPCPVASPMDCPAANRGQTQVWNSSTDLDTCPYLRNGPAGACSATCVPVSIAGKTVGVLHATTPDQTPPDRNTIDNLELIARKSGERIGMLRAFARSETQAHTDPLTGLMNRRSLEAKLHELTEESRQYVVVFGDLDHFKMLNDVHGHDAGDRALRLFARILRDSVRPNDLACRYGGEEFLIVLPECTVQDAQAVLERIREKLVDSLQDGTVPPFTASFGLVSSAADTTSGETIQTADAALLTAKTTGRNRIVIANTEISDVPKLIEVTDVPDTPPSSEGVAALVEATLAE